jgi:hypothetical protein
LKGAKTPEKKFWHVILKILGRSLPDQLPDVDKICLNPVKQIFMAYILMALYSISEHIQHFIIVVHIFKRVGYHPNQWTKNARNQLLQQKTIKQSHGKIYGTKFVTELRQFL